MNTTIKPPVEKRLEFLTKLKALLVEYHVDILASRDGGVAIVMLIDPNSSGSRFCNSFQLAEASESIITDPRHCDAIFDDLMEQAKKA